MYVDILIIGGGPAGLSAAQYGARAALKTLCVEQSSFGGQALLITALENYPGNSAGKSGGDLCEEMRVQAERFGAGFRQAAVTALRVEPAAERRVFKAELDDGSLVSAGAVILAMGAGHRLLDVEGEDRFAGRGVSYCASCDGPFFKNKKIFVAGGGDAACDEAVFLARLSPDVTMLVRRGAFRAQKALAQRVLEHPSIKVRFNAAVAAIHGDERLESLVIKDTESGAQTEEAAGALFVFAGIVPRTGLVNSGELTVELDAAGFITTGQDMAASVPGLFAAGDIRSSPFRQVVTAAADGAIAAHAAADYLNVHCR